MKSEMFFFKSEINKLETNDTEGIISLESPPKYESQRNIILKRGINKEEYDEVYEFLRDQNVMSSGNITLFPKDEIARFIRMDSLAILMRGGNNNSLIGTIFSMMFPIRCTIDSKEHKEHKIITHGCTSFLNVHSKLRKHGMCMALIRELTQYAFEKQIYCSYSLTSFPLSEKSFEISAWFRPLNLPRSIGLGFSYPDWSVPSEFVNNKVKYNTKIPKGYICERVTEGKAQKALEFYISLVNESNNNSGADATKFVFFPTLEFFKKWIQEYATFLVMRKYSEDGSQESKIPVGIFSLGSIYCRMQNGIDGKLALPLIFKSSSEQSEYSNKVMKCMIYTANDRDYDTLYMYSVGDMNNELLKSVNAIETSTKSYFSLYNNSMTLTANDLCIPLF